MLQQAKDKQIEDRRLKLQAKAKQTELRKLALQKKAEEAKRMFFVELAYHHSYFLLHFESVSHIVELEKEEFYCDVCEKGMSMKTKMEHLETNRHKEKLQLKVKFAKIDMEVEDESEDSTHAFPAVCSVRFCVIVFTWEDFGKSVSSSRPLSWRRYWWIGTYRC